MIPEVIRIAALLCRHPGLLSPRWRTVIGSMPSAIVGGVSFILYGMISAIGVRNVVENQVDFTKSRNLIIAAVILVCGLGFSSGHDLPCGRCLHHPDRSGHCRPGWHHPQRHPAWQRL